MSGRHRAPADPDRIAARPGLERRGAGIPRRDVSQPRAPQQHLGTGLRPAHEVRPIGAARDLRSDEARRPRLAGMRRIVRRRLPEIAAIAVLDPAREARQVWRPREGALHRRSGEAHRQRVHVPGARQRQYRGPEDGGRLEDRHVVSALRQDDRRRLREVRLPGRDRPLVGVRRGAVALVRRSSRRERRRKRFRRAGDRYVPRSVLSRTLRRQDRRAARAADAVRRRDPRTGAQSRQPVLLRRRWWAAVRRQGRGTGQPHQRRPLQAAAGHGRRNGRHRLSVLLDHAEGRAGERGRRDAVRRPDDLRRRQITTARVTTSDWRQSRARRLQARLIPAAGYPLIAALGATFRWRTAGAEQYQRVLATGRQPIMAFWHGRILPATVYFQRRGIVVITSENFDGEWIAGIIQRFGYGTARGSTSRGAVRALVLGTGAGLGVARGGGGAGADEARHDRGEAGGFQGRWPAGAGKGRAAGGDLARAGYGKSDRPVPYRARPPLDREQLGPHAD